MKKQLSVLTAALIALSTCSGLTGKSVLAEDVYYSVPVQNAGLEESGGADTLPGFTDETIYTTGYTDVTFDKSAYSFVEITDAQAHTGCKSLRVFDGTHYGSARALTNAIPITIASDVQYTASFWAKVPTTPVKNPRGAAQNVTKLKVRFKGYHANGSIRTDAIGTAVNVAASADGWQQYEIPAFTPSKTTSYIKLEFYSDTGDYVDAYIDDIEVKKVNVEYTNSASETPKTYNRVSFNNADFEAAVNSSWSLVSPAEPTDANKIEFVSGKGFSESKGMHFINTASGATTAVSEYYTASAGDTFRGSFKVYLDTASITTTTSEAMYARLHFYNSSKVSVSPTTYLYKKVFKDDANARWISLWFDEVTAPANTAFVRVEFWCLSGSRADAYIDDVVLYSTGTCEAEPIPATYTDIEVPNPGFENGIESWELYSDYALDETVNYEIAEDIVNSGSKSLRIYDGNKEDGDVLLASPRYKVQQEGTYKASAYIYNVKNDTSGSRALLYVDEFDGGGNLVKSTYTGSGSVAGDYVYNTWKQYSCEITVQPETRYIRIIVGCSKAWNSLSTYFDDITLSVMDENEILRVGDASVNAENGVITASLPIVNTKMTAAQFAFITAAYDASGRLVEISTADNAATPAESTVLTNTIGQTESMSYVTNFVWSGSIGNMQPYYLAEKTELK